MNKELRLLTSKPIIYGANVDEDGLGEDNEYVQKLKAYAAERGSEVIKLCAKVEEDMVDFDDDERDEMLADLGVTESGLEQIIHKGFDTLGSDELTLPLESKKYVHGPYVKTPLHLKLQLPYIMILKKVLSVQKS